MTHFQERLRVVCPPAQAAQRLHRMLVTADGRSLVLDLRLDVRDAGLPAAVTLHHGVVATVSAQPRQGDMAPRYAVHWEPDPAGPFPVFDGELAVEGDEDYDAFYLCLNGAYAPPLGFVGEGFDALLGKRIAHAAARELLQRIGHSIEAAYRLDEERKVRATP